jgi:photosystem II stability/assembly factor-like uncharacterized protein
MKKTFLFFAILFCSNISFSNTFQWVEQNSGTTQTLTSLNADYIDNIWVCGYGGTVLRSTNLGVTWINVSGNGIPTTTQLINIAAYGSGDVALTAGYVGTNTFVYRTSNGGANWTQVFTQPNGFINGMSFTNEFGFMTGDPVGGRWSLWKTSNGGINWDSAGLYLPQVGTEAGWNNSVFGINYNQYWFGTNNSRIYYSSNSGSNWTIQPTTGELNSYAIWFCRLGGPNDYNGLIGGSTLQSSSNSGSAWLPQTSAGAGNFAGITGGPNIITDNSAGYLARFYIRTNSSIYSAQNGGINWSVDYTAPSGNYRFISSSLNGVYFWAVRDNGGISYLDLPVGIEQTSTEVPETYSLSQNYPNPFNPSTNLEFGISELGYVTLKVFNTMGVEVATLVSENKPAGKYKVNFSANEADRNLSSGVYYYSFSLDGKLLDTKRMMLLK